MSTPQPGILEPVPAHARYLAFGLLPDGDPAAALEALTARTLDAGCVIGIGPMTVAALDKAVDGLHEHPSLVGPGVAVPSTPEALWIWLRGNDRGELLHLGRNLEEDLAPGFELDAVIDGFMYADSRDLSGYEDGTENPTGDKATEVALVRNSGAGLDGGSFVAVQQWVHDLDHMQSMPQSEQDDIIGRRRSDNEEFDEAPPSAHVKRTAQESFDPEAFILRRSMPWSEGPAHGLIFVAFGNSFDAFEAILKRMVGHEDGITDGLFRFTRPVTGSFFWCPPLKDGHLDLTAIGL